MFDIFKKNKSDQKKDDNLYINIGALLIHAAKIDENYSEQERKIIKKTLLELGLKNDELDNIFQKSEEAEKNSNQILEFTKEVKNKEEEFKIKIVEALWKIIYADDAWTNSCPGFIRMALIINQTSILNIEKVSYNSWRISSNFMRLYV